MAILRPQRARKFYNFVSQSFPSPGGKYGLLDHMAVERGGYEVIREGVAILEAEAGRGTSRASIAQLARCVLSARAGQTGSQPFRTVTHAMTPLAPLRASP